MNRPVADIRLNLLGRFEVLGPGVTVPLKSKKTRALLTFLAIKHPESQSRERLMALLWGSHFDRQARQNLRHALVQLRSSLGAGTIVTDDDLVGLRRTAIECDAWLFRKLFDEGSHDALTAAVRLYRGDLVQDLSVPEQAWNEWLQPEREALHNLAVDALIELSERALGVPDAAAGFSYSERALKLHEFREDAHRAYMRSLVALGRRSDAIQHYEKLAQRLHAELNTRPEPATQECVDLIRANASSASQPATADALDETWEVETDDSIEGYRKKLAAAKAAEIAVGEILKMMGRPPRDSYEVFNTILDNALRLCDAELGILFLYDKRDGFRAAHMKGVPDAFVNWLDRGAFKVAPETGLGRVESSRRPVSIADVRSENVYEEGDPLRVATADLGGARSFAAIPMLAGDDLKGAFTIYRQQVRPFSGYHIDLVGKFADQAVIALENARLLNETRALSEELAALNKSLQEQVDKQVTELERLSVLRRFLAPEIVEIVTRLNDESLLASHRRKVAIIFCDLKRFAAFAEAAEPEEVMEVLEAFHLATGQLVGEHQGTISHRSGDGLMVVLNDPVPIENPAESAIRLARRMQEELTEMCATWQRHGYDLGFGIGLSLGYATLGLIGSEHRYDYTAIGTVVNLASQLRDRTVPGEVLLTRRVLIEAGGPIPAEPAGELHFDGLARPVEIYRLKSLPSGATVRLQPA